MKVTAHPEVRREVSEAARYLNQQRPGHGKLFKEELRDAIRLISSFPNIGRLDPVLRTRSRVIKTFKYVIHYEVRSTEIRLYAVAHGHRRPGYWQDRIGT